MKIRTPKENNSFINYLESAIDKAEHTVNTISYTFYPEINKEAITKLKKPLTL